MATPMQERAAKDTVENLGRQRPKSKKQILLDAGYSDAVAKNPDVVIESKGFQSLLDKYFPDDDLLTVGKEGLAATKVISATVMYRDADEKTNDFIEIPDYQTRHKYFETALELKGRLKQSKAFIPPPGSSGALLIQWGNQPE